MSNALKDLFTDQANAIRYGLGDIGKISPSETPAMIRQIADMIGTGGDMEAINDALDAISGEVIGETQYTVTFIGANGEQLWQESVYEGDNCPNPVNKHISAPTKASTTTEIFTYSGWSIDEGGSAWQGALSNITSNRTVYAAFTSKTRYYTVKFYDGANVVKTEQHEYNSSSSYVYNKTGARFMGWTPSPTNIQSDLDCYGSWEFAAFATDDWADIIAASESGEASKFYAVGDEKELKLNYADGSSEKIVVCVAGFGIDKTSDGTKVGMTIIAKNALATPMLWGTTNYQITDGGNMYAYTRHGFEGSDIRTHLDDVVMPALPTALQNGLKAVSKSYNYYNGANSSNKLTAAWKTWIPSPKSVTGSTVYNDVNSQYPIYSDATNRIATLYGSGEAVKWWTTHVSGASAAYAITASGDISSTGQPTVNLAELYIVLGFCI